MEPLRDAIVSRVDGLSLRIYGWQPQGAARACVVIAHGIGEHALRYAELGDALVEAGYAAWALDHRGHGESLTSGGFGDPGSFESTAQAWDALISDLCQLLEWVRAGRPGMPIVLLGHSMGSFVAQAVCTRNAAVVDALILSGTTLVERQAPPAGGGFHPGNLHELADLNARFRPERTPYDWLSRDRERVDAYISDPGCGMAPGASSRLFGPQELMALSDSEALKQIPGELPVLLISGEDDPLSRGLQAVERLRQLWREAGLRRIDTQFYAGGRHEMLNETNRDEVVENLIGWLAKVV